MCNMEKDLNKLWVALEDRVRKVDERVTRIEDKVDGADINAAQLSERVQELEKQRDTLRDNITYLQSQSMRNNLIFTGLSEDSSNGSEPPETTEKRLRQHLHDACKVARDVADSIKFERVHRSPSSPISGKVRNSDKTYIFQEQKERSKVLERVRWDCAPCVSTISTGRHRKTA
ncbi:hypothetical protein DPMN_065027 [Dreissena polymorpha]|uniref:Uncharacterized protein n=1 Tax=Dreissena polymorpha TaxID=45954 RepID=A0A9D4HMQ2_DREPO|nr:hypothetical protein DPMN_065027 [Dreissena polymorpha]